MVWLPPVLPDGWGSRHLLVALELEIELWALRNLFSSGGDP